MSEVTTVPATVEINHTLLVKNNCLLQSNAAALEVSHDMVEGNSQIL